MDPGSLLSIANACYTIGANMVEICVTWKHADKELEQRVVIVDGCWLRTKRQVEFMIRIEQVTDEELRRVLDDLLTQLSRRLSDSVKTLKSVTARGPEPAGLLRLGWVKRSAFVWRKQALDAIIADLEEWQRRFDPSWFLLIKIASPVVDAEVARAAGAETAARGPPTAARNPLALAAGLRSVLAPGAQLAREKFLPDGPTEWRDIAFSNMRAGRPLSGDGQWYIFDTVECSPSANVRALARDVRTLEAKLAHADPIAFGLLNCKGVVCVLRPPPPEAATTSSHLGNELLPPARTPSPFSAAGSPDHHHQVAAFRLVFRLPEGMEVLQSLRQLLLGPDAHLSLSRKVGIARGLARAVGYVHTFAFVHKNVRPESVLCFEDVASSHDSVSLAGFDAFRAADGGTLMGGTLMSGDMSWDRNVYRHPLRQGDLPADRYRMQHDIYSLGVCLLEIGLWESFVEYSPNHLVAGRPQTKFGASYHHFQDWLGRKRAEAAEPRAGTASFLDALAFRLKDYLVEQARTRLAPRMGDSYARVVVSCLTCLDDENDEFSESGGPGVEAGDDMAIAVRFVESVMTQLEEISV